MARVSTDQAGSGDRMPVRSARIPSRTTTLLVVAIAHALVLWVFWRAPLPPAEETETFISTLLPVPANSAGTTIPATRPSPARSGTRRAPLPYVPQAAPIHLDPDAPTAITLSPAVPGGTVDWSAQLTGAADSALRKEREARDQSGALTHKFVLEADPRNPGRTTNREFRWYDAGIHRIDTRGPIPDCG